MNKHNSEFRTVKLETRVEEKQENGKKLVLRGYPILFNTETDVYDKLFGFVREKIEPTALNNTDLTDVYLVSGHNIAPEKVLARNNINMRMEVDETGLFFECELPNTQLARDIYNLTEAGIIDGMSFAFSTTDEIDRETRTRTITNIAELYEITITPFPAYKEASVIAQAEMQEKERKAQIEKEKAEKEKKAKLLEELLGE